MRLSLPSPAPAIMQLNFKLKGHMNYILKNKLTSLLTMLLFIGVTVSCNGQSAETTEEKSKPEMDTQTTTKVKISINGMTCMACVANVKNTIEELEGVEKVEVSLEKKQAIVTYVNAKIEPEKIQEAVNKKGFKDGKAEKLQQ